MLYAVTDQPYSFIQQDTPYSFTLRGKPDTANNHIFVPLERVIDHLSNGTYLVDSEGISWPLVEFSTYEKFGWKITDNPNLVHLATKLDRLDIFQRCLDSGIVIDVQQIISCACNNGSLAILNWLYNDDSGGFMIGENDIQFAANAQMLDWLYQHSNDVVDTSRYSLHYHPDLLVNVCQTWLLDWWLDFCTKKGTLEDFNASLDAIARLTYDTDAMRWLLAYSEKCSLPLNKHSISLIMNGINHDDIKLYAEFLKTIYRYCVMNNVKFDTEYALKYAYFGCSFDAVDWLMDLHYNNEYPVKFSLASIDSITINHVDETRLLAVLRQWINFVDSHGKVWDNTTTVVNYASKKGYVRVLQWLHEMDIDKLCVLEYSVNSINLASQFGRIEVLDFWYEYYKTTKSDNPFGVFTHANYIFDFFNVSNGLDVYNWWLRLYLENEIMPSYNLSIHNVDDSFLTYFNWWIDVHEKYGWEFKSKMSMLNNLTARGDIASLERWKSVRDVFPFRLDDEVMDRAKDTKVLDWWLNFHLECGDKLRYTEKSMYGKTELVEWWVSASTAHNFELKIPKKVVYKLSVSYDRMPDLEWWLRSGLLVDFDYNKFDYHMKYSEKAPLSVRNWWKANKKLLFPDQ